MIPNRSRCLVLMPFTSAIEPACQDALHGLQKMGYPVRCVRGYSAIDCARNEMATQALEEGYDATMWIDSDMGFDPKAVDQLRQHDLPFVTAICVMKGERRLACKPLPDTKSVHLGKGGGLVELLYCGAAFMFVRRECYETVQEKLELPVCNSRFGRKLIPFFQPMVVGDKYLGEDYSFCERVRRAGLKVMADTNIRTWHYGSYGYTWEDAGYDRVQYEEVDCEFNSNVY